MGTLDSSYVYFLTMYNDVAHLLVIKTEAARFCKKVGNQTSHVIEVMGKVQINAQNICGGYKLCRQHVKHMNLWQEIA